MMYHDSYCYYYHYCYIITYADALSTTYLAFYFAV